MGKPQIDEAIDDAIIDDSFKNVANPVEIHRLGREDIVNNRPGDVLVGAVVDFAANGGFARPGNVPAEDGVKVSNAVKGRIDLDQAKDLATGQDIEAKSSEIKE